MLHSLLFRPLLPFVFDLDQVRVDYLLPPFCYLTITASTTTLSSSSSSSTTNLYARVWDTKHCYKSHDRKPRRKKEKKVSPLLPLHVVWCPPNTIDRIHNWSSFSMVEERKERKRKRNPCCSFSFVFIERTKEGKKERLQKQKGEKTLLKEEEKALVFRLSSVSLESRRRPFVSSPCAFRGSRTFYFIHQTPRVSFKDVSDKRSY